MKPLLIVLVFLVIGALLIELSFFAGLQSPAFNEPKIVHHAAVAGSWYPADAQSLDLSVMAFLTNAEKQDLNGSIRALIVPHAGYAYSGQVAAFGFRQLEGSYDNVFILGPSHYYPLAGLAVLNATHFATPLGEIPVSEKTKHLGAAYIPQAFEKEHSIEAELPFLQKQVSGFAIIPVLVGEIDAGKLKTALANQLSGHDLLVVSADLSHYHPYAEAESLDAYAISRITNLDAAGIMSAEIDAPWAVSSLLLLARERNWTPVLISYANSGDVTGDRSSVVGYAAVAFVSHESPVSPAGQHFLLNVSRTALQAYIATGRVPAIDESSVPADLKMIKGCFVTLKKNGDLRGCIGHIQPQEPLYRCVIDNTINAAVNDGRFLPVAVSELKSISIEISVLSVPKKLAVSSGIDLMNKLSSSDGVVLRQGLRESTYLPQVWEQLPDKEQFLSSLCLKGSMPQNCWNSTATEVYTYKDFAFSE